MAAVDSTDFQAYLESICSDEKYLGWQDFYTPTDALHRQRMEKKQPPRRLNLSLMVQTIPSLEEKAEKEPVERLEVLAGLRKYADNHVLLVGKPGSGKSTALERLLWEEAEKARTQPQGKIPVLVQLRHYTTKTSVLDIIADFLLQHGCRLSKAEIEQLLLAGKFLLLVDGWNELPDEEARKDVKKFWENYQRVTPMIFTTRELAGNIGIEKRLEMQPLTKEQMQQFVLTYLPEKGKGLWQQLQGRLRELGETPLLLWMLCEVFDRTGNIPPNLGLVFRDFAQRYDNQIKQDVSTDESRERWSLLLQYLAFEMMRGKTATDLRVTIPKQEAEDILTEFLATKKFDKPRECAFNWLNDLLKHHLIQLTNSNREIEFNHQLLQEYYAAERLMVQLDELSDDTLKRDYLNYLKWTEPLALMLALVKDEAQALRVVKLAIEVDLRLGARLAGEVKLEFQEQTVDLVNRLDIPEEFKVQLLGITRSIKAITLLSQALENNYYTVRWLATKALGQIHSNATIPLLEKAVTDEHYWVRGVALGALEKNYCTKAIIPTLIQASKDDFVLIHWQAIYLLGELADETSIPDLIQALENVDVGVRNEVLCALGKICGKVTIAEIIQELANRGFDVSTKGFESVKYWRGIGFVPRDHLDSIWLQLEYSSSLYQPPDPFNIEKVRNEAATITELQSKLIDQNPYVRRIAIYILGQIGTQDAMTVLCQALESEDWVVRNDAVHWLGEFASNTGDRNVFSCILHALQDENSEVSGYAGYVLEKIAIPYLLPILFEMISTADVCIRMILEAISAIQRRCGYYNYAIATSLPPKEANTAKPLKDTLDIQQYEEILKKISGMTNVMERNPNTFRGIEEEALRDHFLVPLNGLYPGQATGETVNGNGKTDILIRVQGENIFIAECKFWGGEEKLKKTLDQLLGYTTWRDTKLALLIFNRNKKFSAVLEQIPKVVKAHPNFRGELSYDSETGFRFVIHHPNDNHRELILTVLAFDIPQ